MEPHRKQGIPTIIGGGRVLLFTRIDGRHVGHYGGALPFGLAICQADHGAVFLFTCEDGWVPVYDSWHQTVDEAMQQAAFQFEGVALTWEHPPT